MVQPEHNARREKKKKTKIMNQESNERERVKICLLRQFHIDCNHTEN